MLPEAPRCARGRAHNRTNLEYSSVTQERQSRWCEATEWAQGATGGDEMLLCDSEKPPGFNFGGGRSA